MLIARTWNLVSDTCSVTSHKISLQVDVINELDSQIWQIIEKSISFVSLKLTNVLSLVAMHYLKPYLLYQLQSCQKIWCDQKLIFTIDAKSSLLIIWYGKIITTNNTKTNSRQIKTGKLHQSRVCTSKQSGFECLLVRHSWERTESKIHHLSRICNRVLKYLFFLFLSTIKHLPILLTKNRPS